jgi:general nucleoside transport system permease protein
LILMLIAGVIGGALYAAIPAILRTRFKVNEVLSSLMLVYVSLQLLSYLITGPWKDPNGHNFPQTAAFTDAQLLPRLIPGTSIPPGLIFAIVLTIIFWIVMKKSLYGFNVRVSGAAPHAARYGGFNANQTIWSTLMISGGMAGLAGILEATSQLGQLNLGFPSGYGFTAIIVSFLGRLNPIGGIFQALMLFLILAGDVLVRYRLRIQRNVGAAA